MCVCELVNVPLCLQPKYGCTYFISCSMSYVAVVIIDGKGILLLIAMWDQCPANSPFLQFTSESQDPPTFSVLSTSCHGPYSAIKLTELRMKTTLHRTTGQFMRIYFGCEDKKSNSGY